MKVRTLKERGREVRIYVLIEDVNRAWVTRAMNSSAIHLLHFPVPGTRVPASVGSHGCVLELSSVRSCWRSSLGESLYT